MGLKLIVFGLLCGTVIQAFPKNILGKNGDNVTFAYQPLSPNSIPQSSVSNLIPDEKQKTCHEKLDWYKKTTEKVKDYYDVYYARFEQMNLTKDKIHDVEVEHEEFEGMVKTILDRYKEDEKKFFNISENTLQASLCSKEISWFKVLDQNLAGIAQDIRSDVSNVLEALHVPKEIRDSLDATLARVVNFLFIIDMSKNTFKDIGSLVKELNKKMTKTVDGLKFEDVDYTEEAIENENDVEKDKEIIGTVADLEDESAIEEAKERVRDNEQKRVEEIENEAREHVEPVYEIHGPK